MAARRGTDGAISKVIFAVHEGDGMPVRDVTMQTLMNELRISSIDILKVDIEGAKKEVFETAPDWFHNVRCLAIELHDRFKPGCSLAVSAVTRDFVESMLGDTTFYIRKSNVKTNGS
jgi:hypothetical protein